jgi:hypothetical protein
MTKLPRRLWKKESIKHRWKQFIDISETHDKAIVAISTAVIAAFTVMLAVATGFLFWSSEKVADAAKQSADAAKSAIELSNKIAERQLRAYIPIDTAQVTINGQTLKAVIGVKNSGQTPAYDLTAKTRLQTQPIGAYIPVQFEDVEASKAIVGPNVTIHPTATLTIPTDSTVVLPALRNGTHIIYVVGHIEYRDIFDTLRHIDFRLRSNSFENGVWILEPAPDGNNAD